MQILLIVMQENKMMEFFQQVKTQKFKFNMCIFQIAEETQ
jgi:hypothetical protein